MDISKYADKLIKQFGLNTCIYEPEQEFYIFYDFNKAYLQFRDIYQAQGIEIGYKGGLLQFAQDLIYFSENLRYKYSTDKLVDLHGQYLKMKQQFPTVGVIIVNDKLDRYLLVQLINNVQWLFPKGFKDPKESDIQCAVRQVKEQTGLNVENYLKQELPSFTSDLKPQIILYVAVGVNDTEVLQPTVRNKISMIKWVLIEQYQQMNQLVQIQPKSNDSIEKQDDKKFSANQQLHDLEKQFYTWIKQQPRADLEALIPQGSLTQMKQVQGSNGIISSYDLKNDKQHQQQKKPEQKPKQPIVKQSTNNRTIVQQPKKQNQTPNVSALQTNSKAQIQQHVKQQTPLQSNKSQEIQNKSKIQELLENIQIQQQTIPIKSQTHPIKTQTQLETNQQLIVAPTGNIEQNIQQDILAALRQSYSHFIKSICKQSNGVLSAIQFPPNSN